MKMPMQLAAAWLVMARTYAPPAGTASLSHPDAEDARRGAATGDTPAKDMWGKTAATQADFAETLRRQLMVDNYDYLPSESDEPRLGEAFFRRMGDTNGLTDDLLLQAGTPRPQSLFQTNENIPSKVQQQTAESNLLERNGGLVGQAPLDSLAYDYLQQQPHAVSKRVLDEREVRAPDLSDTAPEESVPDHTSTKKYKMLKIGGVWRRGGGGGAARGPGARRFLKEESADGIAIMKLDAGPLPEFRLPRARRQYMHYGDSGSGADGDESSAEAAMRVLAGLSSSSTPEPAPAPLAPYPSTPISIWQRTLRPPRMQQVEEDLQYMSPDRISQLTGGDGTALGAESAPNTDAPPPENFNTDAKLGY